MNDSLTIILLIAVAFFFSGCKDKTITEQKVNSPIYMSYEEMRAGVDVIEPQPQVETGKIYFHDKYIYLNEVSKGVHVIDNTNPSDPIEVKFISIPGNLDIAINGKILYADSYIDLVAIDISDLDNVKEVDRIENAFAYSVPQYSNNIPTTDIDQTKGVVIEWEEKIVEEESINYSNSEGALFLERGVMFNDVSTFSPSSVPSTGSFTGIAGSLARFLISNNYLYTIREGNLHFFDVSSSQNISDLGEQYLRFDIETIFIYQNYLYVGCSSGMLIYDLNNPLSPDLLSTYTHATGCDPVVVEDNYAYVTLRSGSACGGFSDQLDVIDISDKTNPILIKTYSMEGPYGLGIDNGTLFICDGDAGLKIYDASDPLTIDQNMLAHYPDITPTDVIPLGYSLITVAEEGLLQYDYSNLENITLLSKLSIN